MRVTLGKPAVLVLAFAATLIATIRGQQPELSLYAAGPGSAFLPYTQRLAALLQAEGLHVNVVQTSGSIDNMRHVNAEPSALATVFLGSAFEGYTGTGDWTDGQRLTNVRALFPMYDTSFQAVALTRSGIRSVRNLSGKRVGVGPAGGPAALYFDGIASDAHIVVTMVNGQPTELVAQLLAGKIDALWQGASPPIPAIAEVVKRAPAIVFGVTADEQARALRRFPFLAAEVVPPDTYSGQRTALRTFGAWNFVVVNQQLPADIAYKVTRIALQHGQDLAVGTDLANAAHNTVLPFHAGAARFYSESGVTLSQRATASTP